MDRTFEKVLDELLEAREQLTKQSGLLAPSKFEELVNEYNALRTELNDMVVTKSWLYDFLTNSADDKGRKAE